MSGASLFDFDLSTGVGNLVATWPGGYTPSFAGIVCESDSTFYMLHYPDGILLLWNINSGIVTELGAVGFGPLFEGFSIVDGTYYGASLQGIFQVDINDPSNSTLVVPNTAEFPYLFFSPTASKYCNTLIAIGGTPNGPEILVSINLLDGAITPICVVGPSIFWLISELEHIPPEICENSIDLDCNDSSGATGADYNSSEVTCFTGGVYIADEDISLFYDAIIAEMRIEVTGFVPDGLAEILYMTGTIPELDVQGEGTNMITLTNTGDAKSTDFKEALRLIRYDNIAISPTGGPRTVEVQFTTETGSVSNIATAFIDVIELPSFDVDIGPDQMICEGQTATFDAGSYPGAMYQWSNGAMTQSITTPIDGQYIVTVSNATHCPATDTALLATIPVITVALTGDLEVCQNEPATLTLTTNATFPITVEIQVNPGFPLLLEDIMGTYSFTDLPLSHTNYIVTSVIPSSDACIDVIDDDHIVNVFPSYEHSFDVSMCNGDSIWLGFYWETQAGVYDNTLNSMHGCDSTVTTNLSILPAVMLQQQAVTCDPAAAGVFITTISNPNGCDTIVQTTVSLLSSDTTHIALTTCRSTQANVLLDTLTNLAGCDSLIITTTVYTPPGDTTHLTSMTCDSALLGVFTDTLINSAGCDSIVQLTVSYALVDTTYLSGTSCIPSQIGVFETLLTDAQGCDSLVISTITTGVPDTTHVAETSCDPAGIGIFEELILSTQGCDSLIITTVTFSAQDSTFITSTTCDAGSAGVFVSSYINQLGCDSIVTETVSLLMSHQIELTSSSCNPADTGVFVQQLINQFGCDSIITATVTLLPSHQTALSGTTCLSSEAGMFITTYLNQYGCDSIVTLTVALVAADTTLISFRTCDPAQTGSTETMYTAQDGCDSVVIETTSLYPLPLLTVQPAIDYNGFDISCTGDMDGSAIANVEGVPPYTYLWSTGDTDQMITGLNAGDYEVAITDGNGCMTSGVVILTEPDNFMIGFEVSEPDCFDQQMGTITVVPNGGVAPYTYSIDGTTFQSSPVFTGLEKGIYQLTSRDANDCSTSEIISINVPLMVHVDLGENQVINIGDSAVLEAIVNLPFDSLSAVMWTGMDSIACADCLTQIVAPVITTAYTVSVTSRDGCTASDSLTVVVTTDYNIYIPNIFSPNNDGINDVLMISAGTGVREIASFSIFDRWGNLVFGAEHKQANDPALFWDGKMKGEVMNSGVFTYRMVVLFVDGSSEVRYGDVTLVR